MAEYIEREAVEEIMQKHRCSDCTNEKSLDCPLCQLHRPFDEISKIPTADVVPRSEVEKLIYKLECFLCHATGGRLSKHTYDLRTMETAATDCINETYNDGYGEGYKDCAREIFEEIERTLDNYHSACLPVGEIEAYTYYEGGLGEAIAELKKKYTEGDTDG